MPSTFGEVLQRFREERKLSLRELGQLSEIDHAYIHRLETGEKEAPSEDILVRLTRALKAGDRKAKVLRSLVSLVGRSVDTDLVDLVLEDTNIAIEDFESAAQMSFRGNRPHGKEAWRKILEQIRRIREGIQHG